MYKTTLLLAALCAASLAVPQAAAAAGQTAPPDDPDLIDAVDPSLWKDDNDFTPFTGDRFDGFDWRLCNEVARLAPPNANLIVSPVSVKLLLAMLYEGAAGATAAELEAALQLSGVDPHERRQTARKRFSAVIAALQRANPDYQLDLALRMFVDDTFTPRSRYNKILSYFYNVVLKTLDFQKEFQAANSINEWVNRSTNGFIKDLVKPDDLRDVEMMLANAVYFDGKWLSPFNAEDTGPAAFFARPGYSYNTSFMGQSGEFYHYNSSVAGAQILRMPYKGNRYSMFVVLPHERVGLDNVLSRLTPELVRQLMWNMTQSEVFVFMPRFSFDTRTDMKEILRAMGVRGLFERGTADLQGVVPRRQAPLFVSSIVQKAVVEVNERGTRAAAATEASTTNRFGGGEKTIFSARRPFLFFIEDETTATVLFVGKVSEPRSEDAPPPQTSTSEFSGETGDLDSRFGSGDIDTPRRPSVVSTTNRVGDDRRLPGERRPEPTTPAPTFSQQPQQPHQPQQPALAQPPYFQWLWRPGGGAGGVLLGRTPTVQAPYPASGQSANGGHRVTHVTQTYHTQQQATNPGVFLVPLYVPIR